MQNTVLCYLEQNGSWLMMNRIKKNNDLNLGKWVAPGGKLEEKESPLDCVKREVFEETELKVNSAALRGIVTFVSDIYETEQMCVCVCDDFSGKVNYDCSEGVIEWKKISEVNSLPIWEGDKIFHDYLIKGLPFFNLKLVYSGDKLTDAYLEGERILNL